MKRFALLTTMVTAVLVLVLPFIGGGGPALQGSLSSSATADETGVPMFASDPSVSSASATSSTSATATEAGLSAVHVSEPAIVSAASAATSAITQDTEHLAQKPVPIPAPPVSAPAASAPRQSAPQSCPAAGGSGGSAPSGSDGQGIGGTTTDDIQSFSAQFNAVRAANCLQPIPSGNFRYDSCMEQRLYWMAEDPSDDPGNTWGHMGVQSLAPGPDGQLYSTEVPSRGCDGNLAGGSGNTGATVAQKWWDSMAHRLSLYKPSYTGSTAHICIYFAMTHGGLGSTPASAEPSDFTRAAARWAPC